MTNEQLLEYSKKVKSDISGWLEQSDLMSTLSEFGEPHCIGSYALDLMYGPDLDIVVKTDNPRKSAIGAVNKVIDNKLVQKLEFGDFVNYPRKARPKGYTVVLKPYINDVRWEVEIWFLHGVKKENTLIQKITAALDQEKKLEILKLKHKRANLNNKDLYTSSFDIYKRVLDLNLQQN